MASTFDAKETDRVLNTWQLQVALYLIANAAPTSNLTKEVIPAN